MIGSLPKNCRTISCTLGILVIPPTSITSVICAAVKLASASAFLQGSILLSRRSADSCSSFARVRVMFRCLGPEASAVINGRLISAWPTVDNSLLAFSAASLSLCKAILSCLRSMPCSFLNSSVSQSMTFRSMSSPPRCVSPLVDLTWNVPSPSSSIETSNVPPPRS